MEEVKQTSRSPVVIFFIIMAALSVSVKGQRLLCRATIHCQPDDILGEVMTERDCCMNNPLGLAYSHGDQGEDCTPCIVVGFYEDSFSGSELTYFHFVRVGYQKGAELAEQDLFFYIVDIPGTARAGYYDYTVLSVIAGAFINNTDYVYVIFHMDNISQEPNETFTLRLDPDIPLPPMDGLFFRDTIQMTIVDSDSVQFSFTSDEVRAIEHDLHLPIHVSKSARIASQIILEVAPMTVEEARRNLPNIPLDDPHSPPYADLNDFNSTIVTLTFEPDEDAEINETSASIPIVDDAINEATEQVFIAELRLVSSLDPTRVHFSAQPSILCRIIDDDLIRIGFELPNYTYTEPKFNQTIDQSFMSPSGFPINGPVYLIKEDNVVSEQSFLVAIQVTSSVPSGTNIGPATLGEDYHLSLAGQRSVAVLFPSSESRINFPFTLIGDNSQEQTEAFWANAFPEDTQIRSDGTVEMFPIFLNTKTLASEIFVIIEDDDSLIGFVLTNYTIDETVGILQVAVKVQDGVNLPASINLTIQTLSGSAIGGSDYQEINAESLEVILTFDNNNRVQSFNVNISDDQLFEDTEDFLLELRFIEEPLSNIILSPNFTVVHIIDNDEIEIGFRNTFYAVGAGENDGLVSIQIGVINGSLQTSVAVIFSINPRELQYVENNQRVDKLTFNSTTTAIDLLVAITDYVFEFSESVVANITLCGESIQGVTLDPASAVINIDALIIGFSNTNYIVNEGDPVVTFTVGVRGGTNRCNKNEWTLYYIIRNVSAQLSEDFNATDLEGEIYVNTSQQASVIITILDDDVFEANKSFHIEIHLLRSEDRNSCVILQPSVVDITILDNDRLFIYIFTDNGIVFTEGVDRFFNLTLFVHDEIEPGLEVVVVLDIMPGSTAMNESDFVIRSDQFLTFHQDERSHSVSIDIVDDDTFEPNIEIVHIGVDLPTNAKTFLERKRLYSVSPELLIADNDMLTIGFNSTTYTVKESDGSVPLSIGVIKGVLEDVTVRIKLITISGSANASLDYDNMTMVLNFSSAVTMQTVNLSIFDDNVLENNEKFTVVLELVSPEDDGRVILQPNATVVSIILDNDTVVIGFNFENYTVSEGMDIFTDITVELISGRLGREVMVTVDTLNGSAKGGEDFDIITDYQLTFSPSMSSHTIPLNISSDGNFEETESFLIILSASDFRLQLNTGSAVNLRQGVCKSERLFSVSNDSVGRDQTINIDFDRIFLTQTMNGIVFSLAANESERVAVGPAMTNVTILDNDTITIRFKNASYSVNECDGQASITIEVVRSTVRSLQRDIAVLFSTSDLTAIAGINYREMTNYSLTFNSTIMENTVDIFIIATNETQPEMDEEFMVSLSFPGEPIPRVTLEPDNATVTIFEINGIIGFTSRQSIEVNESAGMVNLTVELISGKLCGEVEINLSDNTINTTVEDYAVSTNSSLILTTELPNATITINITNDDINEPAESFEITLSFQGQPIPRVMLDPNTTTITILASDSLPVPMSPTGLTDMSTLIGGTLGAISFLLIIGIVLLVIFIFWFNRRSALKRIQAENLIEDTTDQPLRNLSVQSSFKLDLPPHLIIYSSNIKMTETIGQGEFGVVYKGHLLKDRGQTITTTVAIKTLKGFYDRTAVRDMLKECSKMSKFDHPNVLTLNGVCLDGGPAPFIIMPFMMNGSLLAYLRKNRATLVISGENQDDEDVNVRKQLMDMCLQVAKGMEYLAKMKVVHRDLAARNCMIDMNHVIKVADFGLSESVGTKDYFRQDKSSAVKLPLKWLAPESLEDHIFSEKTDVWAYGVTCWEIFSAGKVPYATINPNDLPKMLNNGHRLEKPVNGACDSAMYTVMLQCWEMEPKSRPTFSDLVSSLSQSLEAMVGYMDVGTFGSEIVPSPLVKTISGVSSEKIEDHNPSENEPSQQKMMLELAQAIDESSV